MPPFEHIPTCWKACLKQCGTPPSSAYWIPGFAYSHVDPDFKGWGAPDNKEAKACVDTETSCGRNLCLTRGVV